MKIIIIITITIIIIWRHFRNRLIETQKLRLCEKGVAEETSCRSIKVCRSYKVKREKIDEKLGYKWNKEKLYKQSSEDVKHFGNKTTTKNR